MSANNYMLIYKIGKRWYIWENLIAEETDKNDVLTPYNADKSFDTLEEAVDYANKNDYTEYGYQINNPYKPKDGFKETIEKEVKVNPERISDLENFLFELHQLEGEGKKTKSLQDKTWKEIQEAIDEKVSREQDEQRKSSPVCIEIQPKKKKYSKIKEGGEINNGN